MEAAIPLDLVVAAVGTVAVAAAVSTAKVERRGEEDWLEDP